MFYKERKAAQKRQRLQDRAQKEARFAAEIAAIEKMKDPAEKLLKLTSVEKNIAQYMSLAQLTHTHQKSSKMLVGGTASAVAMAFGSLAVAPLAPHVAVGMMVAVFPVQWSGFIGDLIHNKHTVKALQAEAEDHLKKMKAFTQQTAEMKESLIKNQAEQIAQSPFYEQVLRLPGLSERFAGAAAKQIAQLQDNLAAAEKKAAQRGQSSTPVKKMGNYDKLKNPLGPR